MYRLRPAGNYNIVIKDIGVFMNIASTKEVLIDKEKFDSSIDAKKILNYLIIEDAGSEEKKQVEAFIPNLDPIIVKKEEEDPKPSNVFIREEEKEPSLNVEDEFEIEESSKKSTKEILASEESKSVDQKQIDDDKKKKYKGK